MRDEKFFAVVGWRCNLCAWRFIFISFYSCNHILSLENLPISAVLPGLPPKKHRQLGSTELLLPRSSFSHSFKYLSVCSQVLRRRGYGKDLHPPELSLHNTIIPSRIPLASTSSIVPAAHLTLPACSTFNYLTASLFGKRCPTQASIFSLSANTWPGVPNAWQRRPLSSGITNYSYPCSFEPKLRISLPAS